jgi:hypothetical protein
MTGKPATAWHLSSATAGMSVRARKLATRWMPLASNNRNTSNSRKAMAVAENIRNNRDSNIVIGEF